MVTFEKSTTTELHSFEDYCEEHNFVLWWLLPIESPPWCGSTNSCDWPFHEDHQKNLYWTFLPRPWEDFRNEDLKVT